MSLTRVFTERPYFDSIVNKKMATFQVCYNNFISKVYQRFGTIHPALFSWVKINDKRCHDDSFMFICEDISPIDVPANQYMITTTLRAAVYLEYMAFIQAFLSQLFYLKSDSQLEKFGFTSKQQRDDEVERLSFIYQDLKLAVSDNINTPFNQDERHAILQLID